MFIVHPDILAEAKGLSVGASGFALLVGALLWGLGWRWHRFWIVFGITLAAGLIGMNAGRAAGAQVLVVGILLALAAGMMALEIARVLAFVAGGVAAWIGVQTILPGAREMWAVFLCGGLLGLMLYRLWTMLLTSTAGALLGTYGVMMLSASILQTDVVAYAQKNGPGLNLTIGILAVMGVILQNHIAKLDAMKATEKKAEPKAEPAKDDEEEKSTVTWWERFITRSAV